MFKFAVKLALLSLMCFETARAMQTERFEFEVDGKTLSGLISKPDNQVALRSLVIYVHGYGRTDVVAGNWYHDFREKFTSWGVAVVIWDKPGCGDSEGEFDLNQPIESSSAEVTAAANLLRQQYFEPDLPFGLWSLSRGGWIAPLAIQNSSNLEFWISVSGPDAEENFKYLLEKNLKFEGHSKATTELLVSEWQSAFNIMSGDGNFEDYLESHKNLRKDEFYIELTGGGSYSHEAFLREQKKYSGGEYRVNPTTGLQIYVNNFSETLESLNIPVLGIFGELDTNIDWRKTRALYERTLGQNPNASLELKIFPNADHTIRASKTGGIREAQRNNYSAPHPDEYYSSMHNWLTKHQLAN
jgi:alpha-beta hydrolase superfamily lysophospholipase